MDVDKANAALQDLGKSSWDQQEGAYKLLLKILGNINEKPDEQKFRSVKTTNAAIRGKLLDIPGGEAFLTSVGFVVDGESLTFGGDGEMAGVARDLVQEHANRAVEARLREERDRKIAEEKAKAGSGNINAKFSGTGYSAEDRERLRREAELDKMEREAAAKNHIPKSSKSKLPADQSGQFGTAGTATSAQFKRGG
mmetsp:Transcript_18342/g.44176  ORF Transcript_18342/g.44176 Transcript_18342/m.44176 type:complete len:196 (+) Transcript_18342:30-617(+)